MDSVILQLVDDNVRIRFNLSGENTEGWIKFFRLFSQKGKDFDKMVELMANEFQNQSDAIHSKDGFVANLIIQATQAEEDQPMIPAWDFYK